LKFTLTFWKLEDIIQIDREFLMWRPGRPLFLKIARSWIRLCVPCTLFERVLQGFSPTHIANPYSKGVLHACEKKPSRCEKNLYNIHKNCLYGTSRCLTMNHTPKCVWPEGLQSSRWPLHYQRGKETSWIPSLHRYSRFEWWHSISTIHMISAKMPYQWQKRC
jgi:hypothetical protein